MGVEDELCGKWLENTGDKREETLSFHALTKVPLYRMNSCEDEHGSAPTYYVICKLRGSRWDAKWVTTGVDIGYLLVTTA
jgi:hypothetical protein